MSNNQSNGNDSKRRNRASYISLMMALGVVPRTFQRSLFERSTVDQGIVTGLTVAMVYGLSVLLQDAGNAISDSVVGGSDNASTDDDEQMGSLGVLLLSAAVFGASHIAQKKLPYDPNERLIRSGARTMGYWAQNLAAAGAIVGAIELTNDSISKDKQRAKEGNLLPWVLGAGLLMGLAGEYVRTKNDPESLVKNSFMTTKPLRAVAVGVGVASALTALVMGERFMAKKIDGVVSKTAPQLKKSWLPVGHAVAAGAMGFGLYKYMQHVMNKIEGGAGVIEQGFSNKPTSKFASGSTASIIDWGSLSVQGRRHVGTRLTRAHIKKTMLTDDAQEPIRIFVGLDSASSESARVQLALDELERTGAYDRDLIVVVSPTGSGYVNYVMSDAVEYMSKGNCASVTLQYSKRPSPLSLDRVGEGHVQYRMLLNGIKRRLRAVPENKRPRIVLFGESLGAWTSQDAFLHSGTDGLQALGVSGALWIGTPKGSKWKDQIIRDEGLNTEEGLAGEFDSYEDIARLSSEQRERLRYILITHHNDPISQFGLDLLVKPPEWMMDPSKRSSGMPASARYRTPAVFAQMLIDMKNALKPVPGKFIASGHDYRADLARCVQFAYKLDISPAEFDRITQALPENEIAREKLMQS